MNNRIALKLKYKVNGKTYTANAAQTEHFALKIQKKDNALFIRIEPAVPLQITDFTVQYAYAYSAASRIFANGYQSWTDSMEYAPGQKMQELSTLAELYMKNTVIAANLGFDRSGDLTFHKYPHTAGVFYGWSFGYVRNGSHIDLFGSLSERSGYTCLTFDTNHSRIYISKELEGKTFDRPCALLSLFTMSGEYDDVFDAYFDAMGVQSRARTKMNGYTTWYNYYSHIDARQVGRDLTNLAELGEPVHCFQIDDGYQAAVGDWLITDTEKFPRGMKAAADEIHSRGMKAGLWLAPFAGVKKSVLFQNHPEWFIRGKSGRPYCTGPNWGGFYSLDIYEPGVRDYLHHVFDTVLNEWGYDMVKLDFLYGACVRPMHNKTRGEIMCDAMDLLRECCGDKIILGCGVPLMPAFGKVDYCRIGADIDLAWRQKKHVPREDVSTPHAVCNTIFRRCLDGRAWRNDPDVFLLRDNNIRMDFEQRKLLAKINSTFGNLLFISDNVGDYTPAQKLALHDAFRSKKIRIRSAQLTDENVMRVEYEEDGQPVSLQFNVHTGAIIK